METHFYGIRRLSYRTGRLSNHPEDRYDCKKTVHNRAKMVKTAWKARPTA